MLLSGATACHAPVRTVSSEELLSAHEWAVACSLYRAVSDLQGEAFEQRVAAELGGRLDRC